MGRIANKRTGKLNRPYREAGHFNTTRRGRKPNPFRTTRRRKRKSYKKSYTTTNSTQMSELNLKDMKGCLFAFLALILIIAMIAIIGISNKKDNVETNKIITLEELSCLSHPMVGDKKDIIRDYYKGFDNVSIQHMAEDNIDTNVITWSYASVYGDDCYNDMMINFNNLSTEEQEQLTLNRVIDIVMSFVPAEEIIEYYTLDKSIYVEREDCIEYELYYKEIDEKVNERPHKFFAEHGFSIRIKQYNNNQFEAGIGTAWYDYVYDTNPTVGKPTSKEELATHKEWQFSLEEYIGIK